jgi:hypothetical protein
MHGPINVKSPNNISKWQMEFNSAFKGLNSKSLLLLNDNVYSPNLFGRPTSIVCVGCCHDNAAGRRLHNLLSHEIILVLKHTDENQHKPEK